MKLLDYYESKYGEFGEFLQSKIKIPRIANEVGVVGTVNIQFVVEKDGSISNVHILGPTNRQLGYGVEEACMDAIKRTTGFWMPAKVKNKNVRSFFRIPIEVDCSSGF